jgi:hypothetical protein
VRGGTARSMPLRYVDPNKKCGPIYKANVASGAPARAGSSGVTFRLVLTRGCPG